MEINNQWKIKFDDLNLSIKMTELAYTGRCNGSQLLQSVILCEFVLDRADDRESIFRRAREEM